MSLQYFFTYQILPSQRDPIFLLFIYWEGGLFFCLLYFLKKGRLPIIRPLFFTYQTEEYSWVLTLSFSYLRPVPSVAQLHFFGLSSTGHLIQTTEMYILKEGTTALHTLYNQCNSGLPQFWECWMCRVCLLHIFAKMSLLQKNHCPVLSLDILKQVYMQFHFF